MSADILQFPKRGKYAPEELPPPGPPTLEERMVRAARRMDRPRIIEVLLASCIRISLASRDVLINEDVHGPINTWAAAIRGEFESCVDRLEKL